MMSVSSSKMTKVTIEKIFVLPATLDLMQICFMLQVHALKVITFINKVFTTLEKNPDDQTCKRLAASVVELSDCNYPELYDWLEFLVLGKLEIINFFKDKGYLKFLFFLSFHRSLQRRRPNGGCIGQPSPVDQRQQLPD